MVRPSRRLHITNRDEWRAWLEKHHDAEKEVWLVYYKKRAGKPRIPYEDAVEEALCYGWIDSTVNRIDDEKYMQKFTPRKNESVWSEANKRRAGRMIKHGRMTEAGLAKIREAKRTGQWDRAGRRQYPTEIPHDLKGALAANKKAGQNFENLAPSYRRQLLGWIMSAKRDETRRKRIKETVRLVSQNKKLGMR